MSLSSIMSLYMIYDIIYISWPYTIWLIIGVLCTFVAVVYLIIATVNIGDD